MSNLCTIDKRFASKLYELDSHRASKIKTRKESAMLNLTIDHVAAISRTERDVVKGIIPNMSPNHRKYIEDDLERLAEVKKYILELIYDPCLPIQPGPTVKGTPYGNDS